VTQILDEALEWNGLTIPQAKQKFLSLARKLSLYGKCVFPVIQRNSSNLWFAIGMDGIYLVESHTGTKIKDKNWKYSEIASWGSTNEEFHIVAGNLVRPIKVSFKSSFTPEIGSLYAQYSSLNLQTETSD